MCALHVQVIKSSRLWTLITWGYLLQVVAVWQVMVQTGDVWWPGTLLLFSPRWLCILPVFLMVPYALFRKRLLLVPLICTFLVVCMPFMGFTWSGSREVSHRPVTSIRVVTCNVRGGKFDRLKLAQLIQDTSADIVALQECPDALLQDMPPGWRSAQTKGIAILSHFPLQGAHSVSMPPPGEAWQRTMLLQATVATPAGALAVCSLHLPTPRVGLQALVDRSSTLFSRNGRLLQDTAYRRQAAEKVRDHIQTINMPVIVVGDFNTPPESRLFREVWGEYRNAFSETGRGYGWTQRVQFSGLRYSSRIDHILTNEHLVPLASAVGADVGSDHLPLIADIGWVMDKQPQERRTPPMLR